MQKRICALLLSLTLIICAVVPTALAANQATFQVDVPEKLPAVGESFQVTVSVSGTGGYNAVQFLLNYDDSVVECTKMLYGDALAANSINKAKNKKSVQGEIGAKLAAADATDTGVDGVLSTLTFMVLKSGKSGFKLTEIELRKADGKGINFTVEGVEGAASGGQHDENGNVPNQKQKEEKPLSSAQIFSDVPATFWAFDQINLAAEKKLVAGFPDGTFRPDANVTRAQFVLMLWRMAGEPAATAKASFTDTPNSDWYQNALDWSVENGYVNGVGNGKFDPNGNITRQQAMTILFRYSGGVSGTETMFAQTYDEHFTDSNQIAEYAKPAVYWAIYKGIVTGATANTIAPEAPATRAQIAVILLRYLEKY